MPLVAGVDSSTQSTKVVVRDATDGSLVRQAQAPHPDGTEIHPDVWWQALAKACAGELLADVAAISVAAQQHGMIVLDEDNQVIRPALLWNDTRSASATSDLITELGGSQAWAEAVGSVPTPSFTIGKLRWLTEHEPDHARRAQQVMLPHDWLTLQLTGQVVTDRGDASGTGYYSPTRGYRRELLRLAFGGDLTVPRVAEPAAALAPAADQTVFSGNMVAAGTGDNMAAALALDPHPGDVVVSLGTSGTAFAVTTTPSADPSGHVAGFADATGNYLPLVCTLNAARVPQAAAHLLGRDHHQFDQLALGAEPGAGGLSLLPYLEGERTPNLPEATGRLDGITTTNLTPQNLARAYCEGMLCGLAEAVDALAQQGVPVARVLLVGGAARSAAVRAIAPQVFARPVAIPENREYVADGAARQAAWALSGAEQPPIWAGTSEAEIHEAEPAPQIRERYAHARAELVHRHS